MKPKSPPQPSSEREPYQPPAIIYEGKLSTRAGTPDFESNANSLPGIDPADIFGNS